MSEFDSKALSLARQAMALTRQEHIGGEAQLLAKIQCLFIEAMEYAAPQSFGNSEQLKPVSQPYKLEGEVVAWDHPTKERSVDFRWLNYDVAPGTQLYAITRESE